MLNAKQTLEKEPLLSDGLLGGGYYVEYRTDDARLTIEVIKKAVELMPTPSTIRKQNSFYMTTVVASSAPAADMLSGQTYDIRAKNSRQCRRAMGRYIATKTARKRISGSS
ncbi:hypothetical protein F6Y04_00100 [Bacillus megaterium]|nr:hypothetical protein [Priestia megaterium]